MGWILIKFAAYFILQVLDMLSFSFPVRIITRVNQVTWTHSRADCHEESQESPWELGRIKEIDGSDSNACCTHRHDHDDGDGHGDGEEEGIDVDFDEIVEDDNADDYDDNENGERGRVMTTASFDDPFVVC